MQKIDTEHNGLVITSQNGQNPLNAHHPLYKSQFVNSSRKVLELSRITTHWPISRLQTPTWIPVTPFLWQKEGWDRFGIREIWSTKRQKTELDPVPAVLGIMEWFSRLGWPYQENTLPTSPIRPRVNPLPRWRDNAMTFWRIMASWIWSSLQLN